MSTRLVLPSEHVQVTETLLPWQQIKKNSIILLSCKVLSLFHILAFTNVMASSVYTCTHGGGGGGGGGGIVHLFANAIPLFALTCEPTTNHDVIMTFA